MIIQFIKPVLYSVMFQSHEGDLVSESVGVVFVPAAAPSGFYQTQMIRTTLDQSSGVLGKRADPFSLCLTSFHIL